MDYYEDLLSKININFIIMQIIILSFNRNYNFKDIKQIKKYMTLFFNLYLRLQSLEYIKI